MEKNFQNFITTFAIFLAIGIFCVFGIVEKAEADASDNVFGWAWSDNVGWICFNSVTDGSPFDYGVNINDTTGEFSGYAWSDNVGWITFNSGDLLGCPAGECKAKVDSSTGEVSGWAKVLITNSWIRLSDRTNGFVNDDVDIDKNTKEFHNHAWSDDYGWISFNCKEGGPGRADICGTSDYKVYTTLEFGVYPSNLSNAFDGPCAQSRIPTLSWETSDAPFDYELEIDGNTGTIQEFGTIESTNGSWSASCQKCCDIAPYNDITFPNKTYNWRVKVKTATTPWSGWVNSSFTTLANCYPNPNFTLDPEDPVVGSEIQLCSTDDLPCLIRESVCYSAAGEISCHTGGASFLWTSSSLPPDGVDGSYLDGTLRTDYNPKIQLDVISDIYIILEITDTGIVSGSGDCSDNRAGCCAIRNDVTPGLPLPEWEETSPKN